VVVGVLEGVVVAVGVGREDEPQFRRVDDLLDALVGGVVVHVVVHQPPGHLRGDPLARVLGGEIEDGGLGAVLRLLGVLGELQRQDVLAVDGLADGDDLGQARVGPCGGEDLLPQSAVRAVRPEHALGRGLDTGLRLAGEPVLGEVDALFLELVGLLVGEIDLDGGRALVGHLLAEFVAVLSGGQQQGYLLLGDVGAEDLDLVSSGGRTTALCLGNGCDARSPDQERADSEDRSRSMSHEPPLRSSPQQRTDARLMTLHDRVKGASTSCNTPVPTPSWASAPACCMRVRVSRRRPSPP
jgi:hypothetical protein